ncbi:hypothetical protein BC832DRAFT_539736 [Gaertneriomyces semiglobifer]|nr:hypothetical protein BC832DRAFT_539736 [Gaertneriomyces semiglobifer]
MKFPLLLSVGAFGKVAESRPCENASRMPFHVNGGAVILWERRSPGKASCISCTCPDEVESPFISVLSYYRVVSAGRGPSFFVRSGKSIHIRPTRVPAARCLVPAQYPHWPLLLFEGLVAQFEKERRHLGCCNVNSVSLTTSLALIAPGPKLSATLFEPPLWELAITHPEQESKPATLFEPPQVRNDVRHHLPAVSALAGIVGAYYHPPRARKQAENDAMLRLFVARSLLVVDVWHASATPLANPTAYPADVQFPSPGTCPSACKWHTVRLSDVVGRTPLSWGLCAQTVSQCFDVVTGDSKIFEPNTCRVAAAESLQLQLQLYSTYVFDERGHPKPDFVLLEKSLTGTIKDVRVF